MDTSFLLPFLNELADSIGRGVTRGFVAEADRPTPQVSSLAPEPEPEPVRRVRRRRASSRKVPPRKAPAPKKEEGLTSAPEVGAMVRYRQGRGTFNARVASVDEARGTAVVERAMDGRSVERPFSKLLPGRELPIAPPVPIAEPSVEPEAPAAAEPSVEPEAPAAAEPGVEPEAPAVAEPAVEPEAPAAAEPSVEPEPPAAEPGAGPEAPATAEPPPSPGEQTPGAQ